MRYGKAPKDVDEYISQFPPNVRGELRKMRGVIRKAAPKAEERISYMMPAFFQNGVLVYFAAFKSHISFFPGASGVAAFKKELAKYETSKGTIRFPLGTRIPYGLISGIAKFRVLENEEKAMKKKKKER